MDAVFYGFLFGVISGCGIGGGSILVPLLVLFMGVSQPAAQGACLIGFLPSAIAALFIHVKNKNVDFKIGKSYIIPGVIFALLGSFAMRFVPTFLLKKGFGVFLVIFAIFQAVSVTRQINREKHHE